MTFDSILLLEYAIKILHAGCEISCVIGFYIDNPCSIP